MSYSETVDKFVEWIHEHLTWGSVLVLVAILIALGTLLGKCR